MNPLALLLREARHRWATTLLGVAWVAVAVAAWVVVTHLNSAAYRETKRVQRDIGFNLRIVPKAGSLDELLLAGYTQATMPESVADRLAEQKTVVYNHLVATLHGQVDADGGPLLVTGLSPTKFPPGKKKPPMSPAIKPGNAHLGSLAAERLTVAEGGALELGGGSYRVERVAPATGGPDDLRVWLALSDAQELLGKPGQINEVQAIDCLCLDPSEDPAAKVSAAVTEVAPETQVVMRQQIATARARQRQMLQRLAGTAGPVVLLAGAAGLAVLAWLNVRRRAVEIGVLRVLGRSSATVAGLVLGRAALVGLIGALLGAAIGVEVAESWAPSLFPQTGAKATVDQESVRNTLLAAPLLAVAAAAVAASLAVVQSPAVVLRDE